MDHTKVPAKVPKRLYTLRLSQAVIAEARSVAVAEDDTTSNVLRKAIRRGLQAERRDHNHPDGEAA